MFKIVLSIASKTRKNKNRTNCRSKAFVTVIFTYHINPIEFDIVSSYKNK